MTKTNAWDLLVERFPMLLGADENTHNWNLAGIDQSPKALDCIHTVCRIAGSIGDYNGEWLEAAYQIVQVSETH